MSKNRKEIKQIIAKLRKLGWRIRENRGHYWCIPPDGKSTPLLIASSPNKDRSLTTTKVRLKNEYGVDIDKIK